MGPQLTLHAGEQHVMVRGEKGGELVHNVSRGIGKFDRLAFECGGCWSLHSRRGDSGRVEYVDGRQMGELFMTEFRFQRVRQVSAVTVQMSP